MPEYAKDEEDYLEKGKSLICAKALKFVILSEQADLS